MRLPAVLKMHVGSRKLEFRLVKSYFWRSDPVQLELLLLRHTGSLLENVFFAWFWAGTKRIQHSSGQVTNQVGLTRVFVLSRYVYDGEFEGQMSMLHDTNKPLLMLSCLYCPGTCMMESLKGRCQCCMTQTSAWSRCQTSIQTLQTWRKGNTSYGCSYVMTMRHCWTKWRPC